MDRLNKGRSANRYLSNYCVVDLETTSKYPNSAIIIEISAIRVRDDMIVGEFSTLVNPCCHIPAEATAVNNITDDMVCNAPLLDDVIEDYEVKCFLSLVVVEHGAEHSV